MNWKPGDMALIRFPNSRNEDERLAHGQCVTVLGYDKTRSEQYKRPFWKTTLYLNDRPMSVNEPFLHPIDDDDSYQKVEWSDCAWRPDHLDVQ